MKRLVTFVPGHKPDAEFFEDCISELRDIYLETEDRIVVLARPAPVMLLFAEQIGKELGDVSRKACTELLANLDVGADSRPILELIAREGKDADVVIVVVNEEIDRFLTGHVADLADEEADIEVYTADLESGMIHAIFLVSENALLAGPVSA